MSAYGYEYTMQDYDNDNDPDGVAYEPQGAGETHDPTGKPPFKYVALLENGIKLFILGFHLDVSYYEAQQIAHEIQVSLDSITPDGGKQKPAA